jgi:hypothetical protein
MFKFLFKKTDKGAQVVVAETQRQTVERALRELNTVLVTLTPKAKITVYPDEGTLSVTLPDQMPDEALALPAPTAKSEGAPPTAS